ncbi:hypothetical protein EMIT0P74_160095 [Pseudomonas sp. IT-P74]
MRPDSRYSRRIMIKRRQISTARISSLARRLWNVSIVMRAGEILGTSETVVQFTNISE